MDQRRRTIKDAKEAEELRAKILGFVSKTIESLRNNTEVPQILFKRMRFELVGHDPLTGNPLNLIEQLNQTYTILATLRAVEQLIEAHPDAGGFQLALGTSSGRDIESVNSGLVTAEVFCATQPNSNQKLNKEIDRMAEDKAKHRYVFFASPSYRPGRHPGLEKPGIEVQVFAVDLQ